MQTKKGKKKYITGFIKVPKIWLRDFSEMEKEQLKKDIEQFSKIK